MRVLTGLNWLGIESNYRLREHSSEYLGSISDCESLGKLHFYQFFKHS